MGSTELREAAQQALEALEKLVVGSEYEEAVEAERAMDALRAALVEPVQEPKPVAWIQPDHLQKARKAPFLCRVEPTKRMVDFVALYTAPPQRKPLTEEEIIDLWADVSDPESPDISMIDFARAIERAHGIGGAPEERNFCSRCGKRTNGIHTCTPPAPLTDEIIADLWHKNGGFHHHFARAIERWLKGNP